MKTRITPNRILRLVLLDSAVSGGLARDEIHAQPGLGQATSSPATLASPRVPSSTMPPAPAGLTVTPVAAASDKPGRLEPQLPSKTSFSSSLDEFVRVAQTGIGESGLLSFVGTVPGSFGLGADQIIYLHRLGISSRVLTAMLQHDADVVSGRRPIISSPTVASQVPVPPAALASKDAMGKQRQQTKSVPLPSPAPAIPLTINSSTTANRDAARVVADDTRISSSEELGSTRGNSAEPTMPADLEGAGEWENEQPELYPVRKPYPVKLSDPILVFKAPVLIPNLVVIEMLP
jgi:hypothetical protein